MNLMKKSVIIGIILLVCLVVLVDVVSAKEYSVSGDLGREYMVIEGDEEDIITIKLKSSTEPISLYIVENEPTTGKTDTAVWVQEDVTTGEWKWSKVDDQDWYLLILNMNEDKVVFDIELTGGDIGKESSTCCTAVILIIGLLGAGVATILFILRKRN